MHALVLAGVFAAAYGLTHAAVRPRPTTVWDPIRYAPDGWGGV